jgi:hypothetical protein
LLNLGACFLKSPSSKSSGLLICPVKNPRPRGLYATTAIPSSRHVSRIPISGDSISRAKGLYSSCTASIWCTFSALRIVAAETSLRPIAPILPSLYISSDFSQHKDSAFQDVVDEAYFFSSASALTVSSIGVFRSTL